jgi:capsular polysaccharide biosynthesis protein
MAAHSIKEITKNTFIRTVNRLGISSKYIGTPKSFGTAAQWVSAHQANGGAAHPASAGASARAFFKEIYPEKIINEPPPLTLEASVHRIYADEYRRTQQQAFVAGIPGGRVWGKNGAVITPDDRLIGDVSREFGKYGGIFNKEHSIFRQLKLSRVRQLKGRIAVVASAGSHNYHHWLFDTLPRIGLLKKAGLFADIDYFIIDYTGLKFQKESLDILGIPPDKIIPCNDNWNFHIQADELIVTSLPARLGTISDWTVEFLRETFLNTPATPTTPTIPATPTTPATATGAKERLYLSRRKAPSRNLVNEQKVMDVLTGLNFHSFYPEDHSIRETAAAFSHADSIISVHGSGFANLAFCSPGTKVVDILAPKHLDPYYWILANLTRSTYAYIFGEGQRLPEGTDLVRNKIDEDIHLNEPDFRSLLKKLNFFSE